MKWVIPLFLLVGCSESGQLDRGYIISQAKEQPQEMAPDGEEEVP